MNGILKIELEEFEQGAWVADIVSLEAFDGSFEFAGVTWTGTAVDSSEYIDRFRTRVIGGGNGLQTVIAQRWYDGNVSLQAAVQDVCRLSGETFGSAVMAKFLTTFQRLEGPARAALDSIAAAFSLIWWIGRDGQLRMLAERTSTVEVEGENTAVDSDSATIANPAAIEIGSSFTAVGDESKTVRHIRWFMDANKFEAQIFYVPFVFRAPVETRYGRMYNARVNSQNADGTIDVIADGKFGVTKVPLFCGVPHSRVKVDSGDQVILGFFGADPQKPFAVAMGQDTTATKEVGRKGDEVTVSLSAANMTTLATLLVCTAPGSPPTSIPGTVPSIKGTITQGSERLKVGD